MNEYAKEIINILYDLESAKTQCEPCITAHSILEESINSVRNFLKEHDIKLEDE